MSVSMLPYIQTQISRYLSPTILVLGTIGNTFIIIMFSRRRQSSCAMYLLFAAIFNSFYMIFNVTLTLYGQNYVSPSTYSIIVCKLRYYLSQVWNQISFYLTVFACIDRFILTTNHIQFRILTRPLIGRYIIGIIILFSHIISIHVLIIITIIDRKCTLIGTYFIIYYVYVTIVLCLIPPILMIIFGFLAYRNMKNLHVRIQPLGNNTNSNRSNLKIHRRDRELFIMVLAESIVHVITIFLYPFIILETAISSYMGIIKSTERILIENFLCTIGVMLLYLSCATPFYTFFVASKSFHRDFKKFFMECKRRMNGQNNTTDTEGTVQLPSRIEATFQKNNTKQINFHC